MLKSISELNLDSQINSIIVIGNQRHDLFKFDCIKNQDIKNTCKGPEALDNCILFDKSYCS